MRYRIGIMLSGGSRRGLAHAGGLRALTESGIEPDCGAGGLRASGTWATLASYLLAKQAETRPPAC